MKSEKILKINDLPDVLLIKHLLYGEYILLKDLSAKLGDIQGKTTTPSNFSQKMKKNLLRIQDLRDICKILNYDIILQKRK